MATKTKRSRISQQVLEAKPNNDLTSESYHGKPSAQSVLSAAWIRSRTSETLSGDTKTMAKQLVWAAAIDEARKKGRRAKPVPIEAAQFELSPAELGEELEERARLRVALDLLGQLDVEARQAGELRHLRELSLGDAAASLGVSESTVYRATRRGLKWLQNHLAREET